ncbi:beta-3-deoxy-D-manno-oct-2-ulosonic acid transferase [Sphingomonas sp.]|uniref:capsular polysaccharide export protein, LipB/KpsS family n=2 Tax=unclassified Sphingomonas TaxID=196159 RepID=UPI000DBBB592|nr:beta-3-deoxy-D-manno-oct-2-ulosonic acid transferase [Sphingomonas sp.]PZT91357.1 MAG: beta-3-deoxy-D-manno-oct-2-ulosonic acid transferase [Sphingomonas sp.]RSV22000.1 beta-3-deoxy-D-manno-oct-2-ulosonic acid transferase [Sphingomonas sp. ABOLH]
MAYRIVTAHAHRKDAPLVLPSIPLLTGYAPHRRAPLLRSPPFPWVARHVAAVSRGTMAAGTVRDMPGPAARDELFAAIRAARVGGAFWLPPVTGRPRIILAPRHRAQARAMDAALGRRAAGEGHVLQRTRDPWSSLATAELVMADADDEIAALALIAGVPVRLFGQGRFGDAAQGACPDAVLRHLCLDTLYRDPFTDRPATASDAVLLLAFWRTGIDANRPIAAATGMAWWKRRAIRQFLWAPRHRPLRFVSAIGKGADAIAAWPSRTDERSVSTARAAGRHVALVEDGFLRSNGLGSALHRPWSITLDWQAAHFDASHPSDLEHLLATAHFDPATRARAAALRQAIVACGIGKYGVDPGDASDASVGRSHRRVLAIGQVRNDVSVRLGGCGLDEPIDLLRAVRRCEPDAEIWYRPHPDVEAGFRDGAIPDALALNHVDRVVRGGSLRSLMAGVDAVHVVTSLAGFEALLVGREVVAHGLPFYAGWSLTRDMVPHPRRKRCLSLDELIAGALILYPRYLDPHTQLPCGPEILVSRLAGTKPVHNPTTWLRNLQGHIIRSRYKIPER